MIRGVRGAITAQENTELAILSAAEKLLKTMIEKNQINADSVASIFLSTTDDITAVFPAKAMRGFKGWTHVPVMCMKEMSVPGSLPMCIRAMMHINTEKKQDELFHVYLDGAKGLRPDLGNSEQEI